ncbi:MAG: short-chain dehydrogenase/reductase [Pseudomonadales bacterium]|jgi:NAD(P)-dependent dehydrogenase (short-subunit alcohol dehydrogenase family)|uniref:SDR family oxidoreductase n=1 Tax=unclassified Ketobacter TaxID=2639109 RepID=UPI000C6BF1A8|nr:MULTISPECIES: SDR family oxidoreductase [unclassified Ketobacter]MAQ26567.1 short-chain dehydrogenase/reductase [Pseudomonadales bacterium]MEC8811941.1 SDR family oxidoreductase [Pseudomonadota bacterium]TNC87720.1 MAG: short-chain dehydrogenase/reductase [Alcanivorax sp.]HAG93955.1 short-chain dehydrogenase/reductase [Gammaproteobacteria bacterium]MBI26300.1 short-chain dehydrogenase/reductase [Pseudomonadales bacterium]|tara:strand:- start:992 stop:1867 length:876 start_codon:yes stop_codon:yes gene_type:complete
MNPKPHNTVFITGCSSGIGRETAKLFQSKGWNVAATMRNPGAETELNQLQNVICPPLDVTDVNSIQQAVQSTLDEFGYIDVVVNNAGYALMGAFETLDREQILRQFDTNVFGLMEVCRAVLPHFRSRNHGTLINVASMVGRFPLPLYSVYNASKFAVEGFTETLIYELENFNINVKLIEPGATNTHFFGRSSERQNRTGVKAYERYTQKVFAVMDAIGPAGGDSKAAAKTIWRAATEGSTQLRYATGSDAKAFLLARRLLPDRLFNRTIKVSLTPWALNTVGRLFYRPNTP